MGTHDTYYYVMPSSVRLNFQPLEPVFMVFFFLLILHPICKAVIAGIACARDPAHRVAPQSPWYFFDPVLNATMRGTFRIRLPIALIGLFVLAAVDAMKHENPDAYLMNLGFGVSGFLAWIAASLIFVASFSPRFRSAIALTAASALFGSIYCTVASISVVVFLAVTLPPNDDVGFSLVGTWASPIILCLLNTGTFYFIWRRIRSSSTHEWFRFES